jgi:hypothetical protein
MAVASQLFIDTFLELLGIKEPCGDSITTENPSFKCVHSLQRISASCKVAMEMLNTLSADN